MEVGAFALVDFTGLFSDHFWFPLVVVVLDVGSHVEGWRGGRGW